MRVDLLSGSGWNTTLLRLREPSLLDKSAKAECVGIALSVPNSSTRVVGYIHVIVDVLKKLMLYDFISIAKETILRALH